MGHLKNKSNEYSEALGEIFDTIPKTVLAAIAVSRLTCGGDEIEHAKSRLAKEWQALYDNGIVPQPPSKQAVRAIYITI